MIRYRGKILSVFFLYTLCLFAERKEVMLPYGDMDQWGIRYITESKIIGGNTEQLYTIGGTDTIRENKPYIPQNDNPWSSSNTYAKCIVETAIGGTVMPERRGYGYCCKMMNKVKQIDFCNISAMVTGSIFLGRNIEPLSLAAKTHPYLATEFGVPFTGHPVALMYDYKVNVEDTDSMTSTEKNKSVTIEGKDSTGVVLYLQYRWEDPATGAIYARRVGTACEFYKRTIQEWCNNHELPISWGNIIGDSILSYEKLNAIPMMARNSKGKMVRVEEVGYSLDKPTHIFLQISSSWGEVFQAQESNILWIDNIRLVYEENEN
mgnify:CR=1 FL=1